MRQCLSWLQGWYMTCSVLYLAAPIEEVQLVPQQHARTAALLRCTTKLESCVSKYGRIVAGSALDITAAPRSHEHDFCRVCHLNRCSPANS